MTAIPAFKRSTLVLLIMAASPAFAQVAGNTAPAATGTAELQTINVVGQSRSTRTENRDSYTTSAMRTTTGLSLSPKETPQSVSAVTKKQLDDRGITRMEYALKTVTGINVVRQSGIDGVRFQSRGFYIDQIEEDGIASTVPGAIANPMYDAQSTNDLAVYDHIEVVRGANRPDPIQRRAGRHD